ncbi:MAG: hypothetical protein JSU70_16935 [Phycisphaerales bacterium]|nr:MAG: hypothetical protein JSU70_16935 [Phycisphaerales bacterium]
MGGSPIGFASGGWLSRASMLAAWILCVALLVAIAANNALGPPFNDAVTPEALFRVPRNQTGPCWFRRWDPNHNYRPVHFMGFENLRAEDARLGIFKTALHKVVTIDDLQLRLRRHETDDQFDSNKASPFAAFCSLFEPANRHAGRTAMRQALRGLKRRAANWLPSIDLSNVSQVIIKNLEYEIFNGDELLLGVRCRRACLSSRSPGTVVLSGQALVSTAGGKGLRGNRITWDLRRNHFISEGICVLTHDGNRTAYRGACVDAHLDLVAAKWEKAMAEDEKNVLRTPLLSRLDRQTESTAGEPRDRLLCGRPLRQVLLLQGQPWIEVGDK